MHLALSDAMAGIVAEVQAKARWEGNSKRSNCFQTPTKHTKGSDDVSVTEPLLPAFDPGHPDSCCTHWSPLVCFAAGHRSDDP